MENSEFKISDLANYSRIVKQKKELEELIDGGCRRFFDWNKATYCENLKDTTFKRWYLNERGTLVIISYSYTNDENITVCDNIYASFDEIQPFIRRLETY